MNPSKPSLATILFTDIVGSTERAIELGDRGWGQVLKEHHARVRREIRRFGGSEIKTMGDGFLAAFAGPAQAIRCAWSIRVTRMSGRYFPHFPTRARGLLSGPVCTSWQGMRAPGPSGLRVDPPSGSRSPLRKQAPHVEETVSSPYLPSGEPAPRWNDRV